LQILFEKAFLVVGNRRGIDPCGEGLLGATSPAPVEILDVEFHERGAFGVWVLDLLPQASGGGVEEKRAA
jgi:hypothetical protein